MDYIFSIISALIGAGSALLVFYLTVKNDKKKEQAKESIVNGYRLSHFSSLTKSSIKHIEDTIANLDLMTKKLDEDNITFHLMTLSPNNSFTRINEIVKSMDMYLAYTNRFGSSSSDNYTQITLLIDFFIMQLAQIVEMHKLAQSFDYERKLKYKKNLDGVIDSLYLISRLDNLHQEDKLQIDTLLADFIENQPNVFNEKDTFEYSYCFIRTVLDEVLTKNMVIKNVQETAFRIKSILILYAEIKNHNDVYKNDLKSLKQSLENSLGRYKEEVKNLIDLTI